MDTAKKLVPFLVHASSCNRIAHFMRDRRFRGSDFPCTCGLAELLQELGLPDDGSGEINVFDLDVIGDVIPLEERQKA